MCPAGLVVRQEAILVGEKRSEAGISCSQAPCWTQLKALRQSLPSLLPAPAPTPHEAKIRKQPPSC